MVLLQYLSQFLTNIIKDSPRVWKVGQALSVVGHRYESYAVEDASFFLQYISARVALCGFDWLKRAGQLRLRLRFAFLRFHGVVPLARPRPATLRAIRATVGSKRQTRIATTTISHRNRVRSSPTEFARGCLRALSVYGGWIDGEGHVTFRPMDNFSNNNSDGLGEIAGILALGLLRLSARKSSQISTENRENPLDFEPRSHGHVPRKFEDSCT